MNNRVLIFLDDNREIESTYKRWSHPGLKRVITRSYQQFVMWIEAFYNQTGMLPEIISFDYLLNESNTGEDCARWLVDFCTKKNLPLPEWKIHTGHVAGILKISQILQSYKYKVCEINLECSF